MLKQLEVSGLRQQIDLERWATWVGQRQLMLTPTRSVFAEKTTIGIQYLEWQYHLWQRRHQSVQKYAQSIFLNHGYLPPVQARILGHWMAAEFKGWTGEQWNCLDELWGTKNGRRLESGWYAKADNPNSSAHGIPQALPGSKMGPGWEFSAYVQIKWGLGYIEDQYTTPCGALSVRLSRGSY